MKKFLFIPAAIILTMIFASCKGTSDRPLPVAGTLEGPLSPDSALTYVMEAMEQAERFHQFEIMSDTLNDIIVEAIAEADTTPTEGYGIVVTKGAASTTFPHLRNARYNKARYDAKDGTLWLTCSAVWGTGIQVDRLYQIRFDHDGQASVARTVDPYVLQQKLCQRLGYRIEGEQITLYDGEQEIAQATNTITDMGGFDSEHPLWIGDQMQYDLSDDRPTLLVTPGVKFTTGLVLSYDDMPTLAAPLILADDGTVSIGDLECVKE